MILAQAIDEADEQSLLVYADWLEERGEDSSGWRRLVALMKSEGLGRAGWPVFRTLVPGEEPGTWIDTYAATLARCQWPEGVYDKISAKAFHASDNNYAHFLTHEEALNAIAEALRTT